jgi:uncharacterized protein (DUF433 family)
MRHSTRKLHTTLRLPEDVMKHLKQYAEGHQRTPSSVIAMALREWVDMQRFPGIDFRWTPTGREAHVSGTGLSVREMWMIWRDFGKKWPRIKKAFPHLSLAQVEAAVAYGRVYPQEVTPFEEPTGLPIVRV